MKKRFISVFLVIVMLVSSMPIMSNAVTFNQLNANNVFLKQEGATTCTLCATTMMMRRYSMLRGDSKWNTITESAVKSTAWINGAGLRWSFSYSNSSVSKISVGHYTLPGGSANDALIQAELKKCPEGIVIYNESVPHAVLLTDYTNGTYYCADPLGSIASGRIPLTSAYKVRINNVTAYWKVTSPIVPGPSDDHTHDYSGARLYQPEHPHEISQRCVDFDSCGGFYWTGENYKDKSCPQCWDVDLSISKSSVTLNIGETATMLASISGVYPDTGKVYYDYDSSVVSYTMNKGELKITGLKAGSTNFTINIYSDLKTSSNVKHLASATVKVEVKAKTYTVKYDANGGSGSMSNSYHTYDVSKNLNANQFSRTGYTFLGWSTNKTAITATYTDKQSVKNLTSTNGTTVTLYAVWKANSYSVGYDPNGGKGEIGKSAHTYDVAKNLNANQFTRAGYTFLGWSTNKNAITATYTDKQSVKNLASSYGAVVNLYAVWKPNTYTIKYHTNGGNGSMSNSAYTYDVAKNLNSNQFTRVGYTFLGWSADKNATTATYTDKQSVQNLTSTNGATVTLYAVWKPNTYTVKYDANGGSGSMNSSSHTYDASKNLSVNQFSRTGYTFLGWSINKTATTATYTDKQSVKNLTTSKDATVTLYAVWGTNTYTLTYESNGGEKIPDKQQINGYGWISTQIPEKTGYTFLGWDALESATNVQFNPGDGIIILADTSVYAVWKQNTYTIKYDANGGTGTMDDSVHTYDVWRTLNINQFSRTGYSFLGWSTDKNATNATYTNIQNVRNLTSTDDETIVLYAVWKAEKQKTPITVHFDGNGVELGWESVTVPFEGKLSLSDIQTPVRQGYKFVRWSAREYDELLTIGNGIYPSFLYIIVGVPLPEEITLYAVWEEEGSITECEKNGHTEKIIKAISPTCTSPGFTQGIKCSVCNEIIVAQTIIPETEHDHVAVVTTPSCTEQGYTTYTCTECGNTYIADYINATGHTPGEWEVVTPANVGVDGLEIQKCSVCDEKVDERVIPALPEENPKPDVPEYTLGDVNGDNKVNAADARIVLRVSAQLENLEGDYLLAADINKDGKINASDARKILRVSAQLETL
ncbi:MAG: InlB B-repeat-containing protein [Clostridia bacterium]|nr:InlB B-repeat-containing protein [Clostridia bacterium]